MVKGTIKTAPVSTRYPVEDGLIAETTSQIGHVMSLRPEIGSTVPSRYKKGLS